MNKNTIIAALAILTIIGSIWGSLMGSQRSGLKDQLAEKDLLIQELQEKQSVLSTQLDTKKGLESTLSGQTTEFKEVIDELVQTKAQGKKTTAGLEAALEAAQKELVVRQNSLEANGKELAETKKALAEAKAASEKLLAGGKAASAKALSDAKAASAKALSEAKAASAKALSKVKAASEKALVAAQGELAGSKKALFAAQADLEKANTDKDRFHSNMTARDEMLSQLRVDLKQANQTLDEQKTLGQDLKQAKAKAASLEASLEETSQALEQSEKQFKQLQVNKNVLLSKISEQNTSIEHYVQEVRSLKKQVAALSAAK